jgi:hypothetical protein
MELKQPNGRHLSATFVPTFADRWFHVVSVVGILWNSKVNCRFHKSPPLIAALRQTNPVFLISSYFSKIHHDILQPSTSRSS